MRESGRPRALNVTRVRYMRLLRRPMQAARADALRERLQQGQRIVPADAGIGDALAVLERLLRRQILPAFDEMRLDHDAENAILALRKLVRHVGCHIELSLELLAAVGSSQPKAKSTRAPRPAKYKYTDENGNEQTWTGQGRTPKAITAAIEAGKTLEDFAI